MDQLKGTFGRVEYIYSALDICIGNNEIWPCCSRYDNRIVQAAAGHGVTWAATFGCLGPADMHRSRPASTPEAPSGGMESSSELRPAVQASRLYCARPTASRVRGPWNVPEPFCSIIPHSTGLWLWVVRPFKFSMVSCYQPRHLGISRITNLSICIVPNSGRLAQGMWIVVASDSGTSTWSTTTYAWSCKPTRTDLRVRFSRLTWSFWSYNHISTRLLPIVVTTNWHSSFMVLLWHTSFNYHQKPGHVPPHTEVNDDLSTTVCIDPCQLLVLV